MLDEIVAGSEMQRGHHAWTVAIGDQHTSNRRGTVVVVRAHCDATRAGTDRESIRTCPPKAPLAPFTYRGNLGWWTGLGAYNRGAASILFHVPVYGGESHSFSRLRLWFRVDPNVSVSVSLGHFCILFHKTLVTSSKHVSLKG